MRKSMGKSTYPANLPYFPIMRYIWLWLYYTEVLVLLKTALVDKGALGINFQELG